MNRLHDFFERHWWALTFAWGEYRLDLARIKRIQEHRNGGMRPAVRAWIDAQEKK
jgi:hypothetical protein